MLKERERRNSWVRKCSARTVDGMHTTKNMRWLSAKLNRQPSALKASVWKHFDLKTDLDKSHTICKLCRTKLKYFGNTTNMRNHIKLLHPEEEEKQLVVVASNQRTIEQVISNFPPTWKERSKLQTLLQLWLPRTWVRIQSARTRLFVHFGAEKQGPILKISNWHSDPNTLQRDQNRSHGMWLINTI